MQNSQLANHYAHIFVCREKCHQHRAGEVTEKELGGQNQFAPPPKLAGLRKPRGVDTTAEFARFRSAFEFKFTMIIGVPKEIKEQEYRVALLPSGAYQLIKRGHQVLVERGAGVGRGLSGRRIRTGRRDAAWIRTRQFLTRRELIVKVKEPLPAEFPCCGRGQILFTYLHLAASRALTEALMKSGVDRRSRTKRSR